MFPGDGLTYSMLAKQNLWKWHWR